MAVTRVYSGWVIGGISIMRFGVIAASGLRMLIEANLDDSKSRNLLRVADVFVVGISGVSIKPGNTELKGMVLSLVFYAFEKLGWSNEEPDVIHDEGTF